MQFIFDHLIAIVVAAVLLGALAILQMRTQQSAIAATADYRSQSMTAGLATTLEREVENMRSRVETERAFAAAAALPSIGADTYRFRLRQTADGFGGFYTSQFSFPTLLDPQDLGGSDVIIVNYNVTPTGETAMIDGAERPIYQATRVAFERGGPAYQTDVYGGIVDFDVTAFAADGSEIRDNGGVDMLTAETPPRVHLEVRTAPGLTSVRGADQTRGALFSTRHARSIRVPAASAPALAIGTDETRPGGIPTLPGDPGAAAPVGEPRGGGNGLPGGGNIPPTTDRPPVTPPVTPPTTDRPPVTPPTTPPVTDRPPVTPPTTPPTTDRPPVTPPTTPPVTPPATPPTTDRPPVTPPTTTPTPLPGPDDPITICHVSGTRKKTMEGTPRSLWSHRSHANDYLGECH